MRSKCKDCLTCLDIIYMMPRRFFHCFLCDIYYDIIDDKLTKIDVRVELKKHLDILVRQHEEKLNASKGE